MLNILKLFDDDGLLTQFSPVPGKMYRLGADNECDYCDPRFRNLSLSLWISGNCWHVENNSGDGADVLADGKKLFHRPVIKELVLLADGTRFRFLPARVFVGWKEQQLQNEIYKELLEALNKRDFRQEELTSQELEQRTVQLLDQICETHAGALASWTVDALSDFKRMLIQDLLKLGPLEPFLGDDEITEIMVIDENRIYVEKRGRVTLTNAQFKNAEHLMRIIERIVSPLGRRIDTSSPMVDARLADGSRVNAIIPPLAADGACLTIRKFGKKIFNCDMLLKYGSVTPDMVSFIQACVMARKNIVVSGGTGSGKTSLLNAVSAFISHNERIVTIEDSLELKLQQPHVVRLEARPANAEGQGAVPIRSLVINSLRMRPDRIVVGECRGGEALDMLQAMNTGHDGSLTTVHANSASDAVSRLETLVLMAGMDLPLPAIRSQIVSAVDIIIQTSRLNDGSRKIISITEVEGLDDAGRPVLREIFRFRQTGVDPETQRITGCFEPMGEPSFLKALQISGIPVQTEWFQKERT